MQSSNCAPDGVPVKDKTQEDFRAIRVFPALLEQRISKNISSKPGPVADALKLQRRLKQQSASWQQRLPEPKLVFLSDRRIETAAKEKESLRASQESRKESMATFRPTKETYTLSQLREKIRKRTSKADNVRAASKTDFCASAKDPIQNRLHKRPFRPPNPSAARAMINSPRGLLSKTPFEDNGGADVGIAAAARLRQVREQQARGGATREWRSGSAPYRPRIDGFLNAPDVESINAQRINLEKKRRKQLVEFKDKLRVRTAKERNELIFNYLGRVVRRTALTT